MYKHEDAEEEKERKYYKRTINREGININRDRR
jgi:hypothetical protein